MNRLQLRAGLALLLVAVLKSLSAQDYWQQRVEYVMNIDFDVKKHQFEGSQELTYYNNSPDTLQKVFYHLYYNAFQPKSMMSQKRKSVASPDSRFPLMDKMEELKETELGYHKIHELTQDGEKVDFEIEYTVLEVTLAKPLPPGGQSKLDMKFSSQVPLQIRRTGRNSFDGVDYSMSQWYPKMAEYDRRGWHAHPYVSREFYAPWGDYEVNITIDKEYVLAGTGTVQNANEVGYGYEEEGVNVNRKGKTLTWQFRAINVHDFVWAADSEYKQVTLQIEGGPTLRFFFIPGSETDLWEEALPTYTQKAFYFIEENFGAYKWPQFSVIQGGDGGMEYNMATLIINKKRSSGVRPIKSLVGTMVHEVMHNWYQGMLATNESYYGWMDEGFVTYAEDFVLDHLFETNQAFPPLANVKSYTTWAKTGYEQPASLHADWFESDYVYARASYTKGAVALAQLSYIMGHESLSRGLKSYFNQWSFKHPDMNDFIRVMEKESNLELDWFFDHWIYTTHTIDYAIGSVKPADDQTILTLDKIGQIPMPLDIKITRKDGSELMIYVPISLMRGEKPAEFRGKTIISEDSWWTQSSFEVSVPLPYESIDKIELDASNRMADIDRSNNVFIQKQF